MLAGIVQRPLRDVFPDDVAGLEADRIDGLDFDGPLARRQETRSTWRWIFRREGP
jgi:hypothetical protein